MPEFSLPKHFVPLHLPGLEPDAIPPNYKEQQFTDSTPPSLWFDAVDTYGRRGYVADPTLLQKSVRKWHAKMTTQHIPPTGIDCRNTNHICLMNLMKQCSNSAHSFLSTSCKLLLVQTLIKVEIIMVLVLM